MRRFCRTDDKVLPNRVWTPADTRYFAMPPGKRLGRHTDTAEETQYILSGAGELLLDDGPKPVRAGDVFVLKQGTAHDLRNTGSELLRIIAFFSAPQVQQHWTSEVWEPGALEITGTPNS
jgi:quercetin dioxygenase-like cupin family protein